MMSSTNALSMNVIQSNSISFVLRTEKVQIRKSLEEGVFRCLSDADKKGRVMSLPTRKFSQTRQSRTSYLCNTLVLPSECGKT